MVLNFDWIDFVLITVIFGVIYSILYFLNRRYEFSKQYFRKSAISFGIMGIIILIFTWNRIFGWLAGLACWFMVIYLWPRKGKKVRSKAGNLINSTSIASLEFKKYEKALTAGMYAFNVENFTVAKDKFIEALKWNPSSGDAWYYLGKILYLEHKYKKCRKCLIETLKREPNHSDALHLLEILKNRPH